MAIRVTGNTTGASVSTVKPRASVVVVDPVASVTYAVPVAAVAYVELNVAAYLDTTGRFKFVPDSVVLTDGTALSLLRPVDDIVGVADNSNLDVGKGLSESVGFSEVVETVLIFLRDVADTAELSDEQALAVAKALTETVAASDAYSMVFTPGYTDAILVLEAAALSVAKAVVDAASTSDAQTLSLSKIVEDAAALADDAVLSITKPIDDTQLVDDNLAQGIDKALSDGFGLNEQLRFDYSLASTVDNVAFASDLAELSFEQANSELIALADSGFILSQDYCDLTYFAADYVGSATAF